MSTEASVPTRISSPESLAAALPSLLGFTPEESLVMVFVKCGHVVVIMRMDLADVTFEVNDYARSTAQRVFADSILLVTYTSDLRDPLCWRHMIQGLHATFCDAGVQVMDALSIVGNRYWTYRPEREIYVADEGTLVSSAQSACTAVHGQTRGDIVARYLPRPNLAPSAQALSQAIADADTDVIVRAEQCWQTLVQLSGDPTASGDDGDALRARLLVWLQHVYVRDYILCMLAAHQGESDALIEVLVDVALRAPLDLRPRVAGLSSAVLAAFNLSTIPASCMVALADGDSLAELVGQSITHAVPPSTLRELFAEGLTELFHALPSPQHI